MISASKVFSSWEAEKSPQTGRYYDTRMSRKSWCVTSIRSNHLSPLIYGFIVFLLNFFYLNKTLLPWCCWFFPQIPYCEKRILLQFSPWASLSMILGNKFLMLHFLKLYFILLRFLLKFKALIEILWHEDELENIDEQFNVIIGDLADPMEGVPCYQLYTKSFYELVLKPKLSHRGVFLTRV